MQLPTTGEVICWAGVIPAGLASTALQILADDGQGYAALDIGNEVAVLTGAPFPSEWCAQDHHGPKYHGLSHDRARNLLREIEANGGRLGGTWANNGRAA